MSHESSLTTFGTFCPGCAIVRTKNATERRLSFPLAHGNTEAHFHSAPVYNKCQYDNQMTTFRYGELPG
jgi:hypothetical protein